MSTSFFAFFRLFFAASLSEEKAGDTGFFSRVPHIKRKRACKPGSVRDLLRVPERPSVCGLPLLAGSSRLPGTVGPTFCSSTALLRIEFTAPTCLHAAGELLPRLSTLTPGAGAPGRYLSVALVRGSPLAGVTRYPCPAEPGLSSRTAFRLMPAVVRPACACDYIKAPGGKSTKNVVFGPETDYNKGEQ